jgi:thiamine-phosphate pyrophosphorylase
MDTITARILDANANRAREALRVLEDYARFGLNDAATSGALKTVRHGLAQALQTLGIDDALCARDTPGDVGITIKTATELQRPDLAAVVIAAGKRLSEALRVLEEIGKTRDPAAAQTLERLRYTGYTLEQTLVRAALQSGVFRILPKPAAGASGGGGQAGSEIRLYVLLTEALCRRPWEDTLAAILDGGAQAVQLREKSLPDSELLRRAEILADRCARAGTVPAATPAPGTGRAGSASSAGGDQAAGGGEMEGRALAIINDRPDIALLAASARGGRVGLHLGQSDLPCAKVRALVGHSMPIGVSTENLDQAQEAVRQGASYIGVGPMFPTSTKDKPRLAGPAYAKEALAQVPIPCVAIGGITLDNLDTLLEAGVRTIAVCAAIIAAPDPAAACQAFRKRLDAASK